MAPTAPFLVSSLLVALAQAHGVILNAQGLQGSPASVGFGVDPAIARNCTAISPCQQDATLIREAEIAANIVNSCGRTELGGNIDVGENTENAIAAKQVTQVQRGSEITVTIHQVNADGAGPYVCDLDETSNGGVVSANLTVTNNVPGVNGFSQAKTQAFDVKVQMPQDFKCIGGSTGNICTVRCRNNALAGPFGGCFAVQQVDTEPNQNNPNTINTIKNLDLVLSQVEQNTADFPAADGANQVAGSEQGQANRQALAKILSNSVVSVAAPTQTPDLVNGGAPPAVSGAPPANETPAPPAGTPAAPSIITSSIVPANPGATAAPGNGNGNGNNNNGNAGNGNAGNGNAGNGNGGNGNAGNGNGNGNAGNGNGNGNNRGNTGNGNAGNGNAGNGNAGNGNGNAGNGNGNNSGNNNGNTGNGNGNGNGNNRGNNDNDNANGNQNQGNGRGNGNGNGNAKRAPGGMKWAKRAVAAVEETSD